MLPLRRTVAEPEDKRPVTGGEPARSVRDTERDGYAAGTPSWIDIGSTDLDATHALYTGLFGWERQDAEPVELTGGYGSTPRAARRLPARTRPELGVRVVMYVSVDDAAETAAARSMPTEVPRSLHHSR